MTEEEKEQSRQLNQILWEPKFNQHLNNLLSTQYFPDIKKTWKSK